MLNNFQTTGVQMTTKNNVYEISIVAGVHPQNPRNLLLKGKFKVPYCIEGVPGQSTQVLKHIVLVVTRSGNYQALTPFRDMAVFNDDVQDDGDGCSGFFNVDVMDHLHDGFNGAGDYYVLCSIGTFLSNIVKVTLTDNSYTA